MNNLFTFYIFEIEYALVALQITLLIIYYRYFRLLLFDATLIKSFILQLSGYI